MSFIAVAIGGSALLGGILGSKASKSAAQTQAGAANTAAQISKDEFNTITAQQQPFIQSGYGSLNQLNYLLGNSPGVSNPTMGPTNWSGYSPLSTMAQPQGSVLSPWNGPQASQFMASQSPVGGAASRSLLDPLLAARYGLKQQPYEPNTATAPGQAVQPGGGMATDPGRMTWQQGMPGGPTGENAPPQSAAGGYGSLITPFTAENFKQMSPAYQFQLQQGQQGVLNGSASGQGALSGSTMKDLIDYNQGLANTSFNTAFNQYQTQQGNIYSRLSGLAELGQNAAANTGAQGTALAGQAGQSVSNAGSALAAGQIGAANAWSSAASNASAMPWLVGMFKNSGGGGSIVPPGDTGP